MKNVCATWLRLLVVMGLLGVAGRVAAQAPGWAWAVSMSNTNTGSVTKSVAVDTAGNAYIAGYFSDTLVCGTTILVSAGGNDIFVAKLTGGGGYEWAVRAGGRSEDIAFSVAVDESGNVLVAGDFDSAATFGITPLRAAGVSTYDLFVAKLSPTGAWQWAARAGTRGNEYGGAVATDSAGNVILAGEFSGSATSFYGPDTVSSLSGLGSAPLFVAKLSPDGIWQWATPVGGSQAQSSDVVVDRGGNVIITGDFAMTATFGATTLRSAGGASDAFAAKLSPTGTWQWAVRGGGPQGDAGYAVAADASGSVIITGIFNGSATFGPAALMAVGWYNAFVAKLSPAGVWQWATQVTGNTSTKGIAVDANGHILITGDFQASPPATTCGATTLTSVGSHDIFVAQMTPAGAWEWATSVGSIGLEYAGDIAAGGAGQIVVTGQLGYSTTSFAPLPFANTNRLFIAGLSVQPQALASDASYPAFTLAPNPAHTTATLTGASGPTAALLDGLGRVVRTVPLAGGAATLDVRGLPAGLYLVQVGGAARRLMVE